jgi:hypothetical protein
MRVGVAADLVPAGSELAYLLWPQEARRAEHHGGDQEMAAQSSAFERIRNPQRAGASVVEGKRDVGVLSEQSNSRLARGQSVEVALELPRGELVPGACRSRESDVLTLFERYHLVVAEDPGHGATLACTRPASIEAA